MLDLVLHGIFWAIFAFAVVIELVSIYLDIRVMLGRSRVSGMWGVALGFFSLLGVYGSFLASRKPEKSFFTAEIVAVLIAIGLQIVFHVLIPLAYIYYINWKETQDRDG